MEAVLLLAYREKTQVFGLLGSNAWVKPYPYIISSSQSWLGPDYDNENSGELVLLNGIETFNFLKEVNAMKIGMKSVRSGFEPSGSALYHQRFFKPDDAEETWCPLH